MLEITTARERGFVNVGSLVHAAKDIRPASVEARRASSPCRDRPRYFVGGFFFAVPVVVGAGVVVPVPLVPVPVVPVLPPVPVPDPVPGLPVLVPEPVVPVLVPEPVEPEPIVLEPEPEDGALLEPDPIELEPGDVVDGLDVLDGLEDESVIGEDVVLDVSGVFAGSLLPPQARTPTTHALRTR